jgi:hypothetical protein
MWHAADPVVTVVTIVSDLRDLISESATTGSFVKLSITGTDGKVGGIGTIG